MYTIQQGWPTSIQGPTKWNPTLLDFKRRTYHRKWSYSEVNKNCYTKQEARCNIETSFMMDTWVSPNASYVHEGNSVLTRTKWTIGKKLNLNCPLCLKYSQSNMQATIMHMSLRQEIPIHPWTKLTTDIFHFEGESYLPLVDYAHAASQLYTNWNSMTAQHIINHFKLIFSQYGWPDILVSDNGSCYASEAFTKTMQEYHVNRIISSPHYPLSNGLAEKFVQIVKNLFHKAREEAADLFKILMIYRNTPLASTLQSHLRKINTSKPQDGALGSLFFLKTKSFVS